MAAPSLGSVSASAQTTGLTNNADAPATVNADDIIIRWAVAQNVSDPPTAFTWPSGFTELIAVQIFDELGAHIGLAGLAWKRAVGDEDATTLAVTRNGTGGTSSCFLGGSFTIVGCETSGNPYDVVESSNPSAVSPLDFPSITTLTADSFIITGMLKAGENDNYSTPSGWTVISSNGGTGGTDSAADWDYRVANTVGTFDPTSPTVTIDADTAYALFQIAFIPPGAAGSLAADKAGAAATVPGADVAASGAAPLAADVAGVAAAVPGAGVAASGAAPLAVDVAGVSATVPGADLSVATGALAAGVAGTGATVPGADLWIRALVWAVAEFADTASSAEFPAAAAIGEFVAGAPAVAEFADTSRPARYASPTRLVDF